MEFVKYKTRGAYHWEEISKHPIKRNPFLLGRYNNIIRLLKKNFQQGLKGVKLLDVGCGDGALTYLIAKEKAEVTGVDNSEVAIRLAREKAGNSKIQFIQASAYKLPCADDEFDAVVSSDVIEHLDDTDTFLNEIKRVTKPGGVVIINTPIRLTENPLNRTHVFEFFPLEFKKLIESKFIKSEFMQSHPVFWLEFLNRSTYLRVFINIFSFLKNPFTGFNNKFRYNALQYSISRKE